jgi:hypothetical protein
MMRGERRYERKRRKRELEQMSETRGKRDDDFFVFLFSGIVVYFSKR